MIVRKDWEKFSAETFDIASGCFHCRIDRHTNKKQAPLTRNTKFAPAKVTNKPPNAGPIIPEILNCKPPKVAAEPSSEVETTSGTIDVQVGAFRANPPPRRKTPISIR